MTLKETLNSALQKNLAPSAHLDAAILLSFVLNQPKEFIYSHPEYSPTKNQLQKFTRLIARRAAGEPLAYLTGHKEFYGLDFIVNKNTLIPRPETELIVDEVLELIKKNSSQRYTLIDVGTGSGCLPIALAKNLPKVPNIKYYGLDISPEALKVAKRNATLHNISRKITFAQSDLLKNIFKSKIINLKSKIILTANLPYLSTKQYQANPDLKYEPRQALIAGPDGLKYYRLLIKQIKSLLRLTHYPLPITFFLEIDPSQTANIKKVIHSSFPLSPILVKKDLAGLNRLVIVNLNHPTSHSERR